MNIFNIDLNNINLDNNFANNFYEVDDNTIILVRLLVWHHKFKKCK